MATTMQPIKNDLAVEQMAIRQTTPARTSHLTPQSPTDISRPDKTARSEKSDKSAATKDFLSGAATAPANEATSRLTALQGGKELREIQVLAVRTSKAVEKLMESMKEMMEEIVSSYPPFLRGSEKRQQYLMSISSIRQQIEAMTIPPIKLDTPALDVASSNDAKKMWTNLFHNIGIPALEQNGPNEASDSQIKAVSLTVIAMREELSSRRNALEQQVVQTVSMSSVSAEYRSQLAGQNLAVLDISLTINLTGGLKAL